MIATKEQLETAKSNIATNIGKLTPEATSLNTSYESLKEGISALGMAWTSSGGKEKMAQLNSLMSELNPAIENVITKFNIFDSINVNNIIISSVDDPNSFVTTLEQEISKTWK